MNQSLTATSTIWRFAPSPVLFRHFIEEAQGQAGSLYGEVRSSKIHHDRCLIVDESSAYLSGTSFAQGTNFAPTTLTEVVDIFDPLSGACETLWAQATVEPLK